MWGFASKSVSRSRSGSNKSTAKPSRPPSSECSDDEPSLNSSREEGLECPICWESFNVVENVPYVLWCGHTLCKNCIQGLQRAVVKLPTLPVQLPFFISCPWCNLLSFRLVYKGNMRFPSKNYILLWMVESMNGDRSKSSTSSTRGSNHNHQSVCSSVRNSDMGSNHHQASHHSSNRRDRSSQPVEHPTSDGAQLHGSVRNWLVFFVQLTAKFPLIVVFLLIVLYAIPASAAVLALYILITVLFALPSVLILYFAFPSLDWLVREIIT
ncbi:hypothetical protein LINPERPRIM_LOCUS28618 [Linum perenne]